MRLRSPSGALIAPGGLFPIGLLLLLATVTHALGQRPDGGRAVNIVLGAPTLVPDSTALEEQGLDAISASAVSPGGRVVLADNRRHQLRVFERSGRQVAIIPLKSGAGDVVFATAMAVDGDGRVFVYDQVSRMVHEYTAKHAGPSVQPLSFNTGVVGTDLCVMGTEVYVLGYRDGEILHQYTAGGRLVRSFGRPYGSTEAVNEAAIGAGSHLACVPERGLVLVAYSIAPVVVAYNARGTERWTYTVPNFRSISVRSQEDGSVAFSRESPAIDAVLSVFPATSGLAVVQVGRGGRPDPVTRRPWAVETFVLRLDDGVAVGSQTTLPRFARGNSLLLISIDPGPALRIRAFAYRILQGEK